MSRDDSLDDVTIPLRHVRQKHITGSLLLALRSGGVQGWDYRRSDDDEFVKIPDQVNGSFTSGWFRVSKIPDRLDDLAIVQIRQVYNPEDDDLRFSPRAAQLIGVRVVRKGQTGVITDLCSGDSVWVLWDGFDEDGCNHLQVVYDDELRNAKSGEDIA